MTHGVDEVSAVDHRNARLYLSGLGLSLIGDNALRLVAGIWVKSLTGSSALAGLAMMCVYLPALFGPLAGLLVDRVSRQRFIVVVNLCTAVAVASLLFVRGAGQVWLLYVVMIAYGTSLVLIDPAETALFTHMLPPSLRQRVNGWRLGMQETGRLVAPLVGAGLFAAVGGGAVAMLDAATFLVAAWTTSKLRPPPESPAPTRGRWRTELMAGFAHIRATPRLMLITSTAATIMAVSGLVVAAQFSMVTALHKPPAYLGIFSALLGAGSVIASLSSSRMIDRVGLERLTVAGLVAFTAATVLRAVPNLPAVWAGSFLLGFALPWVFLATLTAAQQLTPNHLQGRVAAAVSLLLFAPQAPTLALGSLMVAHLSYQTIYLVSAGSSAILAAILATRIRGLRATKRSAQ